MQSYANWPDFSNFAFLIKSIPRIMLAFPNCKINIGLDILARRPDGYHDIETIMVPVPGLYDGLEIIATGKAGGAEFSSSGDAIDCAPERNLVIKTYNLMSERFGIGGVKIHLHKSVPSGAGLGGGSSDSAFTIKLLNDLFHLKMNGAEMESLAAELGSDTSFFIRNSPQLCSGRGEIMTPATPALAGKRLLIVTPPINVSTAEAYKSVIPHIPSEPLSAKIAAPLNKWKDSIENAFEKSVFSAYPLLGDIKSSIYEAGAVYAAMSGSGSAIFGIFDEAPVYRAGDGCKVFVSHF